MSTESQMGPSIGEIFKRSNQVSDKGTQVGPRELPSELVMLRHDDGQDYVVFEEKDFGFYINTKPERTQIDGALVQNQITDGKYVVTRPFSFNEAAGVVAQNVALNDLADDWEHGRYSTNTFSATMNEILGTPAISAKADFDKLEPALQDAAPENTYEAPSSELS